MRSDDVGLGYLAVPEVAGPRPGVVMIPDVRGLYGHFRDLAERLAGEGFAVLAIDHIWVSRGLDVECARNGWSWLSDHRPIVADLSFEFPEPDR